MNPVPLAVPQICQEAAAQLTDRAAAHPPALIEFHGPVDAVSALSSAWLVAAIVLVFVLTIGMIAGFVIAMRRRPQQPTPEQELIDEILRGEAAGGAARESPEPVREPWEQPADWWKKSRD